MTEGSIFKSIILFSLPLLVSSFFQQFYNTVDSYVVGNYVSTNALAAVGSSAPIVNTLLGFFMGLSAGAGVVISQYFGAKSVSEMRDAIHSSLALTTLLGVLFTVVGLITTRPILLAIRVPEEILPDSILYLNVYYSGILFSLIFNMGAGILRAIGDSTRPLIYLIVSSLVNVVLDFLFVCSFHMGVAGVAIATVFSQIVSAVMVMIRLMNTREDYRIELKKIRFHKKMIHRILSIGVPTALQISVVSFSNVVVQSYINHFGTAAVAGYSAGLRIEGFWQLPIQGFNMTITTFVGQNIGARQPERVKKGAFATWLMSFIVILVSSVTIYFCAPMLIRIFTNDASVVAVGSNMLKIYSYGYITLSVVETLNGVLNGAGFSKVPMFFMLGSFVALRQLYLFIIVPLTNSLPLVFAGWPLTWLVCAISMAAYYFKRFKRDRMLEKNECPLATKKCLEHL
ncbi:MAG: MATE family efflux transporter [Clostridiaceae bacterium]